MVVTFRQFFSCLVSLIFFGAGILLPAEEEAAAGKEKTFKLNLRDEPEAIRAVLLEETPKGTDVYTVARTIVKTIWEGEQRHPLKHKSGGYFYERQFHGDGYILVVLGETGSFKTAFSKKEVQAIYVFDRQRKLKDILVKKDE